MWRHHRQHTTRFLTWRTAKQSSMTKNIVLKIFVLQRHPRPHFFPPNNRILLITTEEKTSSPLKNKTHKKEAPKCRPRWNDRTEELSVGPFSVLSFFYTTWKPLFTFQFEATVLEGTMKRAPFTTYSGIAFPRKIWLHLRPSVLRWQLRRSNLNTHQLINHC